MPLDDNSAGRADHLVAASPDVGPDTQARRSRSANEGGPHGLAGQSPLLPTLSGASSLTDEPVTEISDRRARLALAAVAEPGDRRLSQLMAQYGATAVWRCLCQGEPTTALGRRAQSLSLEQLHDQMAALNLRFIVPGDPEWPLGLDSLGYCEVGEMAGPPIGLWLAGPGRLSDYVKTRAGGPPTEAAVATELTQTAISVAVVGSRAATAYGEHVAAEMAAGLAERGLAVISGGAYGIDAAAHRAALAVGGRTLALMAGGLAQVYPPGNARLLEQIRAEQLLISEHPPTRRPSRPRFLARNRLIAALTQATVVVEGGVRSGAANTVRWALGLQRPVLAVPGPVTSALSATPHRLIRDGEAILVTSADDVIAAVEPLDPGREQRPTARPRRLDALAGTDRTIYEDLPRRGRVSVDELALRTGFTTLEVMTSLGRLAQQELVETTAEGWWRLVKS